MARYLRDRVGSGGQAGDMRATAGTGGDSAGLVYSPSRENLAMWRDFRVSNGSRQTAIAAAAAGRLKKAAIQNASD